MTFDEWWMTLLPAEVDELKPVFKECWNTAIERTATLVDDRYDECEPWLKPDEVRELKVPNII